MQRKIKGMSENIITTSNPYNLYNYCKSQIKQDIKKLSQEKFIKEFSKTKEEYLQNIRNYDYIIKSISIKELQILEFLRISEKLSNTPITIKIYELLKQLKELLETKRNIFEDLK